MSFETMDWDNEAKRLTRLLGITETCEFCAVPPEWWEDDSERPMQFVRSGGQRSQAVEVFGEFEFSVEYSPHSRDFSMVRKTTGIGCLIIIGWDGAPLKPFFPESKLNTFLARALFHLDLLTPEVEAALGVAISSHQKLEWKLQHESKNDL